MYEVAKELQFDLDYPAMSGLAPIRISNLAGYGRHNVNIWLPTQYSAVNTVNILFVIMMIIEWCE